MPHMQKNAVAENIVRYRKRDGLTQYELSEKIGYSDKSVSKWERGDSIPDVPTLLTLADVFGVSLNDLVYPADSSKKSDSPAIEKVQMPPDRFTWKHCFITLLAAGGTVAAAILTVCLFQFLSPSLAVVWTTRILCYGAAGFFLVWLVLACLWWPFAWRMFSITGLLWSAAVSVHITFRPTSAFMIYAAAAVLQILVTICYIWKCVAEHKLLKLSFFT